MSALESASAEIVPAELSLIVLRGGKPVAEYLLHVYCGPDNTARMIGGY